MRVRHGSGVDGTSSLGDVLRGFFCERNDIRNGNLGGSFASDLGGDEELLGAACARDDNGRGGVGVAGPNDRGEPEEGAVVGARVMADPNFTTERGDFTWFTENASSPQLQSTVEWHDRGRTG